MGDQASARRIVSGRAYLLTGRPGVGKTTCLRKVLDLLGAPAGGFLTDEIREGGRRVGFALVTLDNRRATLAHIDRSGAPRVGKYGVNLDALDHLGVPAIRGAVRSRRLVVIDEIGKMEMAAPAFREAVDEALKGPAPVLGTILAASHPWADRVKAHARVQLIEVTPATRESLPRRLAELLASGVSG
ncbi:MAG: NTPase [Candidatus Methylomirabilia bacterium]